MQTDIKVQDDVMNESYTQHGYKICVHRPTRVNRIPEATCYTRDLIDISPYINTKWGRAIVRYSLPDNVCQSI